MAILYFLWLNLFPLFVRFYQSSFNGQELVFSILYSLIPLVPFFFLQKRAKLYIWSLFLPLLVFGLLDIFYSYVFKTTLVSPVVSTVFESNPGESSEFISMYLSVGLFALAFIYCFVAAGLAHFSKALPPLKSKRAFFRLGMLLLAFTLLPLQTGNWIEPLKYHNLSRPLEFMVQHFVEHQRYAKAQEQWKKGSSFSTIHSSNTHPQTLVLVIGESLTRRHMQLFGYARETNPLLSKRPLYLFNEVSSPSFVTVEALKTISTFATVEKKERYFAQGNIIDYFKQAGFRTYWFSNQQMMEGRLTAVSANAFSADEYRFLNKSGEKLGAVSYDEVLLPALEEALQNPASKKLIVLHLLGSHMSYKFRYPLAFASVFQDEKRFPPFALNDWQKNIVNEYDRSVLYTDMILDQVLERLEKRQEETSLIFLSDHGEEVFDSMDFVGHVNTSEVVYQIPFLLWLNKRFEQNNKNLVKRMKRAENRPWRSDGLPHLLIGVAGLQSEEYDPLQDLFSPVY